MSRKALVFFVITGVILLIVWEIYVGWYAPKSHITLIIHYNLDKLMHVVGGAVITAILGLIMGPRRFVSLIIIVIFVSVAWEGAELLFDRLTQEFYRKSIGLWLEDTAGDAFFALIGALAATRFVKK